MKIEEALGLVEEVKNCSLPWDDAHWEALGMVIDYVKNKLNKDFQNMWKPSDKQMNALSIAICGVDDPLFSLYQDLKKLMEE